MHLPAATPLDTTTASVGSTAPRLLAAVPAPPARAGHPQLSYLQPVPRHMVHRAAITDYLVEEYGAK